MPSLQVAYDFVVEKCNDPNVRYSQAHREGEIIDGLQYYDCTSLLAAALTEGGFYEENPWFSWDITIWLERAGWKQYDPAAVEWKNGDIVDNPDHDEMVYDGPNKITMGAKSDSYPPQDQVAISKYPSDPSYWTSLWRYEEEEPPYPSSWIAKNEYLTQSEMENNALLVTKYLRNSGWTDAAIAGVLGNMQSESTINPGIWQNLIEGEGGGGGYGLVQWTPWTNVTNYLDQWGLAWDDGDGQMRWIVEVTPQVGQWIPTSAYDYSWSQFTTWTGTPEDAASAFLRNFERPADIPGTEPGRREQAAWWYNYIEGTPEPPDPPDPPDPPEPTPVTVPLWLLFKMKGR